MFLRVLSILHGVSLFRGARDSWETLSVVAKEKYKSSIGSRLLASSFVHFDFAHFDVHRYWIVRVPFPFALALRAG
jgi:hypothetical protein